MHQLLPAALNLIDLARRLGGEPLPPVEFDFDVLDGDLGDFGVHQVEIDEAVNACYRLHVEIVTDDLFIETQDLLGHRARFSMSRQAPIRRFYGLVDVAELVLTGEEQAIWHIELVPALALLGRGKRSRIWQDLDARAIIDEVLHRYLEPFGSAWEWRTLQSPSKRETCTQYDESDLAFVTRLLAEEGIAYFFEADPANARETLVFIDHPQNLPKYRTHGRAEPLRTMNVPDDLKFRLGVQGLRWRRQTGLTGLHGHDFDWHVPGQPIEGDAGAKSQPHTTLSAEEHRDQVLHRAHVQAQVQRSLAAKTRRDATASATTNLVDLCAGNIVHFDQPAVGHIPGQANAATPVTYCVLTIHHRGHNPEVLKRTTAKDREDANYMSTICCIAADAKVLAQTPMRSLVHGPMLGTVVDNDGCDTLGPGSDPIVTDEHGRVRVRLHWMGREPAQRQFSAWLRVGQSWAGEGFGAQFLPRVGSAVLVSFLHGDPDRPVVVASLYDGTKPPVFATPDRKASSGWVTRCVDGQANHSLIFDDSRTVDGGQTTRGGITMVSSGTYDFIVVADAHHAIGGACSSQVEGDVTCTYGGSMSTTVGGDVTNSYRGSLTTSVGDNVVQTYEGGQTQRVAKDLAIDVGQVFHLQSGADGSINSKTNLRLTAREGLVLDAAATAANPGTGQVLICGSKRVDVQAESIRLSDAFGENFMELTGDTLTIKAKHVRIASETLVTEQASAIVLGCEQNVILQAKASLVATADQTITLQAVDKVTLQGALIEAN